MWGKAYTFNRFLPLSLSLSASVQAATGNGQQAWEIKMHIKFYSDDPKEIDQLEDVDIIG
jgi:hypothetical protein